MKEIKSKKEKTCDCLKIEDRASLFCQSKCESFSEYLQKINSFYDNAMKNVENIMSHDDANSFVNSFLK